MGSPSGSLDPSLVHIHNNFVAHCCADMKLACIYYNNQLPAASDYDKEQIIWYISFLGHVKHHMHLATHKFWELRLLLRMMFTVCYHHR